jgi:DNA end-binding protein Ku
MARPLWKGTLGFGLVSIPVEVFTAVKDLGPHFHFLRKSDKSRIGYQKIAKADDEPVEKDELVKGYEYEKGRYVVLSERDFESAAVERNSRIDLLDFVNGDDVDDRYFNKPYYLLPGKGGENAYALLREALRQAGRIGIAKIVMRNKPHLAAVEVIKDAMVLSTMRFREELIPVTAYEFPDHSIRKAELDIARKLIDGLAADWDPDKYTDEYRANLMEIIDAKRRHAKPELEKQEPEADDKVVDLMERLRRSLEKSSGPKKGKKARGKSKRSARKSAKKGARRTARTAKHKRAA